MSRDWTQSELEAASEAMKAAGYMSYEEFCEKWDNGEFQFIEIKDGVPIVSPTGNENMS